MKTSNQPSFNFRRGQTSRVRSRGSEVVPGRRLQCSCQNIDKANLPSKFHHNSPQMKPNRHKQRWSCLSLRLTIRKYGWFRQFIFLCNQIESRRSAFYQLDSLEYQKITSYCSLVGLAGAVPVVEYQSTSTHQQQPLVSSQRGVLQHHQYSSRVDYYLVVVGTGIILQYSSYQQQQSIEYSLRKGKHADGSLPRLWQLKKRMVHFYRISTGDVHPWSHRFTQKKM